MSPAWRAAAVTDVRSGDAVWRGLCLKRARTLLGIPAGSPSAITAWEAIPVAHRYGDDPYPPPGVPVFWRGGKYGHIAVSDGRGWCFSTDIKRRGRLDRVKIVLIHERWGLAYLGWSDTLNGHFVEPGPRNLRQGARGPDVARLQRALKVKADGHFGTTTAAAVNRLKARMGLPADSFVGPKLRAVLRVNE